MDDEYRRVFVQERVRSSVALQIRCLRDQRKMTQKELGDAIGMAQTWVSKLENPEYGKMTVSTLLRLANEFDTDLEIKFRPFSVSLNVLPRQGPDYFQVQSFREELALGLLSSERMAVTVAALNIPPLLIVLFMAYQIGGGEMLGSSQGHISLGGLMRGNLDTALRTSILKNRMQVATAMLFNVLQPSTGAEREVPCAENSSASGSLKLPLALHS